MKTLILNASTVVENGLNDTYLYRFPAGAVEFKDDQIAVSSVSLFYSWFNIQQSVYNNNSFSYRWIDGSVNQVMYPDGGYYTVSDLNAYFQSVMYANGHYLINSTTGKSLFFLEFVENSVYYAIQFNAYIIPTTLPSGFALPAGASWSLPVSASSAQITIGTNNFGTLIGFSSGTYPSSPATSTYSANSNITPQISPVSSLVVSCSLVNNRYSIPSTLVFSFAPNTTFGSLINVYPPEYSFVDIQDGQYTDFTIKFSDQLLRTIRINDNNIVVMLTIRNKYELTDKQVIKSNPK
jgi:hypothetical protein